MTAILPQETAGYVIYFALVGYEGRCPILAMVLGQFLSRKPSHIQDTLGSYLRVMDQRGDPDLHRVSPIPIPVLLHELGYEGRVFPSPQKVTGRPLAQELGEPRLVLDFLIEDRQRQIVGSMILAGGHVTDPGLSHKKSTHYG
jgi:hypothetical protein